MAYGGGLGGSWGFAKETTYGTYVAPTKHRRWRDAKADRPANRVQGEGIQSGAAGPLASQFVETTEAGTGSVAFDVTTKGMGLLWQQIMGATSSSALKAGSAYEQTHTLGDPYGKSLTVQLGIPYPDGTVSSKTLTGCKVTSCELSLSPTELLQATLNLDAQKYDEGRALASPSYLVDKPFHGKQAAVKLGALGSEAAVAGIKSMSLTYTQTLDTDDYAFGQAGIKNEQIVNGLVSITGSITYRWTAAAAAAIHDKQIANTATNLVWEFTDTTAISGSDYPTLRFSVPSIFFDEGSQPGLSGPSAIDVTQPFTWRSDGTNAPTIYCLTADTAL